MLDLREAPLAKKKPTEESSQASEGISVRIDADVYRLVKTVAAWEGVRMSQWLSEHVRPIAQKALEQIGAGKQP